MSLLRLIVLSAFIAVSVFAQADSAQKEETAVLSTIERFAALADSGAFGYLAQIFTKKVIVDYTSAFGGEPAETTNTALMQQWRGLLPGFDFTRHALSNIEVDIDGDTAKASANITASHYLGTDGFWQISGRYKFQLNKAGHHWKINKLTLLAESEKGSRGVLVKASAIAAQRYSDNNVAACLVDRS